MLINAPQIIPAINGFLPFAVKTIDTISRTIPTRNAIALTVATSE